MPLTRFVYLCAFVDLELSVK